MLWAKVKCFYAFMSLVLTYSFVVLFLTECLLYAEYINRFHFLVAAAFLVAIQDSV